MVKRPSAANKLSVFYSFQITERMERLLQEKLQPHTVEVAKDAAKAAVLVAHFEASVHTPAVVLTQFMSSGSHCATCGLFLSGFEAWSNWAPCCVVSCVFQIFTVLES